MGRFFIKEESGKSEEDREGEELKEGRVKSEEESSLKVLKGT